MANPFTTLAIAGLVAACALACSAPTAWAGQVQDNARPVLFIAGASLIDPAAGSASPPQDILILEGRIAAITPSGAGPPPEGATRIDASGRFAMAGLIDVHAHLGEGGALPGDETTRARALQQFLRYGVTSLFIPGATGASDAEYSALRERCRAAAGQCPDLRGAGSLITAPGSHPISTIFNMPGDTPAAVLEALGVTMLAPDADIDQLMDAKKAAGVDAVKIVIEDGPPPWYPKPRLSDAQIRQLVSAAHARSLRVFAHISTSEHVRIALDAGVDGVMHGPTDRLPDDLVRRMAEQKMTLVTTFALYDGILTWARGQPETDPYALAGVEPSAVQSLAAPPFLAAAAEDEATALDYLANASDNLRRATAAGVPIALGTDVGNPFVFPGYSAHEELSWMVHAGLSPAQALQAATLGGAAFLDRQNQVGRLAPGYRADILLLADNPLLTIENSRRIVAVIANGVSVAGVVSAAP
jgi:imidazolonepropionase-like amidohydrolase